MKKLLLLGYVGILLSSCGSMTEPQSTQNTSHDITPGVKNSVEEVGVLTPLSLVEGNVYKDEDGNTITLPVFVPDGYENISPQSLECVATKSGPYRRQLTDPSKSGPVSWLGGSLAVPQVNADILKPQAAYFLYLGGVNSGGGDLDVGLAFDKKSSFGGWTLFANFGTIPGTNPPQKAYFNPEAVSSGVVRRLAPGQTVNFEFYTTTTAISLKLLNARWINVPVANPAQTSAPYTQTYTFTIPKSKLPTGVKYGWSEAGTGQTFKYMTSIAQDLSLDVDGDRTPDGDNTTGETAFSATWSGVQVGVYTPSTGKATKVKSFASIANTPCLFPGEPVVTTTAVTNGETTTIKLQRAQVSINPVEQTLTARRRESLAAKFIIKNTGQPRSIAVVQKIIPDERAGLVTSPIDASANFQSFGLTTGQQQDVSVLLTCPSFATGYNKKKVFTVRYVDGQQIRQSDLDADAAKPVTSRLLTNKSLGDFLVKQQPVTVNLQCRFPQLAGLPSNIELTGTVGQTVPGVFNFQNTGDMELKYSASALSGSITLVDPSSSSYIGIVPALGGGIATGVNNAWTSKQAVFPASITSNTATVSFNGICPSTPGLYTFKDAIKITSDDPDVADQDVKERYVSINLNCVSKYNISFTVASGLTNLISGNYISVASFEHNASVDYSVYKNVLGRSELYIKNNGNNDVDLQLSVVDKSNLLLDGPTNQNLSIPAGQSINPIKYKIGCKLENYGLFKIDFLISSYDGSFKNQKSVYVFCYPGSSNEYNGYTYSEISNKKPIVFKNETEVVYKLFMSYSNQIRGAADSLDIPPLITNTPAPYAVTTDYTQTYQFDYIYVQPSTSFQFMPACPTSRKRQADVVNGTGSASDRLKLQASGNIYGSSGDTYGLALLDFFVNCPKDYGYVSDAYGGSYASFGPGDGVTEAEVKADILSNFSKYDPYVGPLYSLELMTEYEGPESGVVLIFTH